MFYITLLIAKVANYIIKTLGLGAGYTWPGHLALKVNPRLFAYYSLKNQGRFIFISGTNGKTTTAKLLTHILQKNGKKVISNISGANLLNGLASALLLNTDIKGKTNFDYAVLETDELVLPTLVSKLEPKLLMLLNLSRDQLDRYGEVDTILSRWAEMLAAVKGPTSLLIDSTSSVLSNLPNAFSGPVFYFDDSAEGLAKTRLVGSFNARNVNAAIAAANLLGIPNNGAVSALFDFDTAYGRGEKVEYLASMFQIFLAKNPMSYNNNLALFSTGDLDQDTVVFVLNDNHVDGRDVSWIYDIDPVALVGACSGRKVFVSGTRCLDFAIRLQYAGVTVQEKDVSPNLEEVLKLGAACSTDHGVVVLPNYSAMLSVREVLTGRKIL